MPKVAEKSHRFSNPKTVRDQFKDEIAASGPNMNPPGLGGNPALVKTEPEEVQAPDIADLIGDAEDRDIISALMVQHAELTKRLKPLDAERDRISDRIKTLIKPYGIDKAQYMGVHMAYFPTTRESLNKMKLLEAGVPTATILACTDKKVAYTLKVTPAKE